MTTATCNARPLQGQYLASTPDTVSWGWIQPGGSLPVAHLRSGETITIDTVSHEGILGDQGRDPVGFFGGFGVPAGEVLADAIAIAGSDIAHDSKVDGPHVVTGPVWIEGADAGDLLTVEVLDLQLRANYGIVSNRHGKGALSGEMPTGPQSPVCRFASVERSGSQPVAWVHGPQVRLPLPLRPFLGLVAVAPAGEPAHSVPPGLHGGNLDVRLLGVGTRLHLPVHCEGALLQVGDPHFAQGDGEVALTALEGPLRAVLRVHLHKGAAPTWGLPYGETDDSWLILGLDQDLDEAVRIATRAATRFVCDRSGADAATAYAWLSTAADLGVSQVVDQVKGVHFSLPKRWLDQAMRA